MATGKLSPATEAQIEGMLREIGERLREGCRQGWGTVLIDSPEIKDGKLPKHWGCGWKPSFDLQSLGKVLN